MLRVLLLSWGLNEPSLTLSGFYEVYSVQRDLKDGH